MKKNIVLAIFCIATFLISCKKDGTSSSNIVHKTLNLSATLSSVGTSYKREKIDNVPITGEIGDEMDVVIESNGTTTPPYRRFSIEAPSDQQVTGESSQGIITLASNSVINSSLQWKSGGLFGFNSGTLFPTDNNIKPGSGDKYIGIRVKLSDNTTHYGWMSLNYSSDSLTITVKEVAYNKNANESIKAGQK